MSLLKSSKQLVKEANEKISTLSIEEAKNLLGHSDSVFIDIRDVRELEREGTIPNAIHAPRGMLEFWVDPDSPYFKPIFGQDKQFILYCQSAWRSALATAALQDMGLSRVCHIDGGFNAWKNSDGEVHQKK
ncbi:rhodanese-like domain-containing protein [Colwelliaceae bacterium BS250]